MARGRTYTRMEKNIQTGAVVGIGAADDHFSAPIVFQLEGGTEECQIKRIVLSGVTKDAVDSEANSLRLGLFQEAPTTASDLNLDEAVIYSIITTNNATTIVNETTTVRVPRGWYLALFGYSCTDLSSSSDTYTIFYNCQLNYKVLS